MSGDFPPNRPNVCRGPSLSGQRPRGNTSFPRRCDVRGLISCPFDREDTAAARRRGCAAPPSRPDMSRVTPRPASSRTWPRFRGGSTAAGQSSCTNRSRRPRSGLRIAAVPVRRVAPRITGGSGPVCRGRAGCQPPGRYLAASVPPLRSRRLGPAASVPRFGAACHARWWGPPADPRLYSGDAPLGLHRRPPRRLRRG